MTRTILALVARKPWRIPALVGMAFPGPEKARFEGLAGIHLTVGVRVGDWNRTDDVMITRDETDDRRRLERSG